MNSPHYNRFTAYTDERPRLPKRATLDYRFTDYDWAELRRKMAGAQRRKDRTRRVWRMACSCAVGLAVAAIVAGRYDQYVLAALACFVFGLFLIVAVAAKSTNERRR